MLDNKSDMSMKVISTKSNTISKITDFSTNNQKVPSTHTNNQENKNEYVDYTPTILKPQIFDPLLLLSDDRRD